jgi:alcohol dehydrogenase class IV
MPTFDFFGVNRILFGPGKLRELPALIAGMGTSAMIVYNGSADRLLDLLGKTAVKLTLRRQRGEPTIYDVDAAVDEARKNNCEFLIGLGGGSAIDAAKAVAGILTNGGSAVDYLEVVGNGRKITKPAIPWIAIPTTAGTGAEATRNAVIGFPEKKFKASIRGELLLPRAAIVDPELAVDIPPDVTARGGMDALCQLIESYTSIGANPITDPLALQGIPLAARSLQRAYTNGHDLDARQNMALAALLSGITLTSAGLGAVHGFAAPLGANFPVPHGVVCAVLLPLVIHANLHALREAPGDKSARALARYASIGRALQAVEKLADAKEKNNTKSSSLAAGRYENENAGDTAAQNFCAHFTANLAKSLNIPPLKQFQITKADVPEMVALAQKSSSMKFNPITLSPEVLSSILIEAIG